MSEVSFCQTLSFNAEDFDYESVEQTNGNATVIKFEVDQSEVSPGDVIVVLEDGEIVFHGMVGAIEDGTAIASDPKGSLLPATIQ
jgi:hypothetical protein